jgi:hypothetical protein
MQQEAIDIGTFSSMETETLSTDKHERSEQIIDE